MMPRSRQKSSILAVCNSSCVHKRQDITSTRKRMTFVNTTAIAYTKIMRLWPIFCPYAIAVVFTNVMRLRVVEYVSGAIIEPHKAGMVAMGQVGLQALISLQIWALE